MEQTEQVMVVITKFKILNIENKNGLVDRLPREV